MGRVAMLIELRLRNLAVIEEVTVPFGPGLNAVTGETGAGKSIVVDAILLVMGARAQPDLIRSGADSAIIEALFELPPDHPAAEVLQAAGHGAPDGTLVLKREISRPAHRVSLTNRRHGVLLDRWRPWWSCTASTSTSASSPPGSSISRPLRGRGGYRLAWASLSGL